MNPVKTAISNPHTSIAAVVLFIAAAVGYIWPAYEGKINHIVQLAIVYGLFKAGDAGTPPPAESKAAKSIETAAVDAAADAVKP